MKNAFLSLITFLFLSTIGFTHPGDEVLTADFVVGNPEIASMNAIAFGPQGILFIGDSKNARIIAIETKDVTPTAPKEKLMLEKVDQQIAKLLGTSADEINITDMAVNPISNQIYFSVHHSSGLPVLFRTDGETLIHVPLEAISHAKTALVNPVKEDAKDHRERPLRQWAVADLAYHEGQVMVSGLSNEEFGSTFRSIAFPFKDDQMHTTLEIYHAAHGKYETHAPIKTFMPFTLHGEAHLLASYTCTPMVVFPMKHLKQGQHIKGRTIAELGAGNTPLDMIHIENEGNHFVLIANNRRPVMKIKMEDIEKFDGSLTEEVTEKAGVAGVHYVSLPMQYVLQMDNYGKNAYVVLQRLSNGDLTLHTPSTWWL